MNTSQNSTSSSSIEKYLYCLMPVKLLIGIINLIFNGYIIRLVVFKIRKKTYSNILFLFNAIADFTSGLISIPSMTLFTTMGYWPLGKVTCLIWVINDFSVSSISAFTLLIIAIHRYLQIIRPTKTKEKMTNTKWTIIALQWISIYSFWVISASIIVLQSNFDAENCYFTYTFSYVFISDLIYYCFPVFGVFILNSFIFYELLKKKNAQKKICPTGMDTNMRSEQRDFKALLCLYVVAGVLILCFAIFVVTWPLKSFRSELVSDLILEIGYWMSYLYTSLNPIILLVFHDKFNKELKISFKKQFLKSSTSLN